ncbi:response regulator [Chloroflexus sp.]|uniref:hybrid sensor histidine kinase/response regulator n=1 Tax=Chloroflexus sp. TaxID=1904827 RepID=UPI002ACEB5E9|nr:response regulator [Chloroflexus sp.]
MSSWAGRVLVVDDDPQLRDLCRQTLARAGFVVTTAANALMALEALDQASFDLVMVDLAIPELNGLQLLEQIRLRDVSVPILIASGIASVEQIAYAMRLGARGLLIKPFHPQELADIARELVAKRQAVRVSDRVAALRPVLQISQHLLAELDQSRLYALIIETVRVEIRAERASLMLLEPDEQALRIVACTGLPETIGVGTLVPVTKSLSGWVIQHRQPLLIDAQVAASPWFAELRQRLLAPELMTALSVPIMAGERVLGVLNAAKTMPHAAFTLADQELLQLLAGQAAVALENARLYNEVSRSEARYRALLRHANDAVLLLDSTGAAVLDANLALARLSGYTSDELLALDPRRFLPTLPQLLATAMNGRSEQSEIETILCTAAGQETAVAVSVSVVPDGDQQLFLVIARDISERQRMARELAQAEKLAAIGRLSASMAHEINNPLQALSNTVRLLRNHDLPPDRRDLYLTKAAAELDGLIHRVQRILDFSRPNLDGRRPVDLNQVVNDVIATYRPTMAARGIQYIGELTSTLPWVTAVIGHLKQVCQTLVQNAIEAMPDGGTLRIRTYLRPPDGEPDRALFWRAGGGTRQPLLDPAVVLEISDTGVGIAQEEVPKIFEPFYSTRFDGLGLGLPLCYSIVDFHGGELLVHSQPDQGTTFRVVLPVAQ